MKGIRSMDIKDLPPWAQAQAVNQIMARQRRQNGRSRAPSPAPLDDDEEPRRTSAKYHNRKAARITPEGNTLPPPETRPEGPWLACGANVSS